MNTFDRIYAVIRRIPCGRVASYGQIARLAGNPRWARVVGFALAACRDPELPCHRVVMHDGRLSPRLLELSPGLQEAQLRAEGVGFRDDGLVDMAGFLWDGT